MFLLLCNTEEKEYKKEEKTQGMGSEKDRFTEKERNMVYNI